MQRRTKLNRTVSAILMTALIVELITIIGISLIKSTICNKQYILNELEKVNYYNTTKAEIEDAFKYYVLQSNLDNECVENLITVEKVKSDTIIQIERSFSESNNSIEIESIKEELSNRIYEKVKNEYNNIIGEKEKKDIEKLVNIIVENYTNNMETVKTCFGVVHSIIEKTEKITKQHIIILYAITLATIVTISALYIIGTKNKKIILNKYHAIAFMTVGFMFIMIIVAMSIVISEEQIQIFTKGITELIVDVIKNIKSIILAIGIGLSLIGLFISLLKNYLLRKYLK